MSCYHPLKGFKIGVNPSGKPQYKITSYDTQYLVYDRNQWIPVNTPIKSDLLLPQVKESIDIPCGHCIGCYLDRSRQWADRCMLEASYHDKNCFLTLTYDDDHLPDTNEIVNFETGEVTESPFHPLVKKDLQLFMKRLRFAYSDHKIRFFACGEYGSKSMRPHYHIILFGEDFSDDRKIYKRNFNNQILYTSPMLDNLWRNGYAVIADCTWNTCAYVSRYCLKKRDNDLTEIYNRFNITPEFVVMSRRPGIAREYYEDHKKEIYRFEEIYISDATGSKKLRPPKYFDRLYDIDYPSDFARIKQHRKEYAEMAKEMILEKTDLDYVDYLNVAEYNHIERTKILNERREI